MKLKIIILCMMIFPQAYANKAFVCAPNIATGFKFNKAQKRWQPTLFNVDGNKFLLKKQNQKWVYIPFGQKIQINCNEMNDDGSLFCDAYFGQLQFNEKTLRYVETYSRGYTNEQQDNDNTPSVAIGECVLLDY